jgi:hypothetical protein
MPVISDMKGNPGSIGIIDPGFFIFSGSDGQGNTMFHHARFLLPRPVLSFFLIEFRLIASISALRFGQYRLASCPFVIVSHVS